MTTSQVGLPARATLGFLALPLAGLLAGVAPAQQSVVDTVHNLSVSGPGAVRAVSEQEVCVFCHAPHHTTGMVPLWNRDFSSASYTIYSSTTLNARPGQPTGNSKYCLSCHDGTIALGRVASRPVPIEMRGTPHLPSGLGNLGTDLSDDHPISFVYSSGLAGADLQIKHPAAIPPAFRLDAGGELQCTTCHDAHRNVHGSFLVADPASGALCNACHQRSGWSGSSHAVSGRTMPAGAWPHATVAQNACASCHRPHGAGSHAGLLRSATEEDNCLVCHAGQSATFDILAEIGKTSGHDPRSWQGRHDPAETGRGSQVHVECADCHDPHAAQAPAAGPGFQPIGRTLIGAWGISIGGAPLDRASFEYEVCLRCHSDAAVPVFNRPVRVFDTPDLRLRFGTGNESFHPVAAPSPGLDTPSLLPGIVRGSRMRCTDCHNNDATRRSGGAGPDGPHGSAHEWLLEKNYTIRDPSSESAFDYALCYKCHSRASLLADESFPGHRKHVQDANTACSACHDPHGVPNTGGNPSSRTHLINFQTSIVFPSPGTNTIRFEDRGFRRSTCTLLCHGKDHVNLGY